MVADDSAAVRLSLTVALAREGRSTVTTAASGDEALDLFRRGSAPCVLLLDLMMFHGHAREFRAAMLAEPRLADIPVLILSCTDEIPYLSRALKVCGWLVKPPDLDELLGLIDAMCFDRVVGSSAGSEHRR